MTLRKGQRIDRYGHEGGSFVAKEGTPFDMRALPPEDIHRPYHVYEVIEEFSAEEGIIAPWFDQKGMGTQYKLDKSVGQLVKDEKLLEIK